MNDEIRKWVEAEAGGRIVRTVRPPTGGSRDLFLLEVERPSGPSLDLVLRLETGGTFIDTPVSLHREAEVYRALGDSDVPTPQLVAFAADGGALLVERLAGTEDFRSFDVDEKRRTYADFIAGLAALHNLDPVELGLDPDHFPIPRTPADHALLDLGVWAGMMDTWVDEPDPMVLYARSWLSAHAPARVQRTVLVQGDTGPGNFLAENGRVTGIVDWEFAHIGDPMADLAWLEMRSAAHGGGLDPTPHLDTYAKATGLEVDQASVDYYRVGVYYRCAVTTAMAVARGGGARGWAPYVLQGERFHASLGAALGAVIGVDEPVKPVAAPSDTPRSAWYDRVLDGIREAVRHLEETELREQTRNLQILVHHLRGFDAAGAELAAVDADDRATSLGISPDDAAALRQHALTAGASGDEPTLRYLLRRQRREASLWGRLMERRH
jgi:aminoglycoside phosphotransferase (APT) family kinase protein